MGTSEKRETGGRVSHWEREQEALKKEMNHKCGSEGSDSDFRASVI